MGAGGGGAEGWPPEVTKLNLQMNLRIWETRNLLYKYNVYRLESCLGGLECLLHTSRST